MKLPARRPTNNPVNAKPIKSHNLVGIPLYHGTASKFDRFDITHCGKHKTSDWGKGIYFTPHINSAHYYRKEAVKDLDKTYNHLYEEFDKLEKWKWRQNPPDYSREDELNNRLRKFQARGRELDKTTDGRVIMRFLSPDARVKTYRYEGMTDPFLGQYAKEEGYDALHVDPGMASEEVLIINPCKLLTKEQFLRTQKSSMYKSLRPSYQRVTVRRKDGITQDYYRRLR